MKEAAEERSGKIVISDPYRTESAEAVLRSDGFKQEGGNWIKHVMPIVISADKFTRILPSGTAPESFDETALLDLSDLLKSDPQAAQRTERTYWPLKIIDAPLPCYIIPIQPRWAAELFDDDLANQDLFGARTSLSLNREGVYYRSAKLSRRSHRSSENTVVRKCRCKVSKTKKVLRACSFLDAVVIGPPKQLFRRFERLGVYQWKHVLELAKGNIDTDIMAIRYSETQLLTDPVAWGAFQPILRKVGIKTQLQSPQQIPPQVFGKLYTQGSGIKVEL